MSPLGISLLLALAVTGVTLTLAWGLQRWLPVARAAHAHHWQRELEQFFLFIDPRWVWTLSVTMGLAVGGLLLALSGSIWVAVCAAASLALPGWVLRRLRQQRIARFDGQLPDALMALAAALRAGAAAPSALRHLALEAEPPLAQEFQLVMREQRLGVPLDQALANLAARLPTEATTLSVAALRIAADTGGNLAEALERVAATVRARLHVHGRIDALTAQGRLQAWVVGALPVVLLLVLSRLEPTAMALLWQSAMGWGVMVTVLVLETLGIWWIRRIVAIDV